MNEFIEKNRRLLKTYYIAARIIGWIIIAMTVIPVVTLLGFSLLANTDSKMLLLLGGTIIELLYNRIVPGIILLVVAQLIKFVTDSDYKRPLLLKYSNLISYFFAALILWICVVRFFLYPKVDGFSYFDEFLTSPLAYLLSGAAKVLILVGLGYFLQRIIPVIEESKTLV